MPHGTNDKTMTGTVHITFLINFNESTKQCWFQQCLRIFIIIIGKKKKRKYNIYNIAPAKKIMFFEIKKKKTTEQFQVLSYPYNISLYTHYCKQNKFIHSSEWKKMKPIVVLVLTVVATLKIILVARRAIPIHYV